LSFKVVLEVFITFHLSTGSKETLILDCRVVGNLEKQTLVTPVIA
jgi:hypothetical protein